MPAKPRSPHVLLVDDNADLLKVLDISLSYDGLEVFAASNAEAAIEAASTQAFDCVVTDFRMPGMDGISLIRRIRSNPVNSRTRAILISAIREVASELPEGCVFVQKPFEIEELSELIRQQASQGQA